MPHPSLPTERCLPGFALLPNLRCVRVQQEQRRVIHLLFFQDRINSEVILNPETMDLMRGVNGFWIIFLWSNRL